MLDHPNPISEPLSGGDATDPRIGLTAQTLAHLPTALAGLARTDALWTALRQGESQPSPTVVTTVSKPLETLDWDVVIGGGTLGILIGAALAQQGWRVALLERGQLQGRAQEWNISRRELDSLVELGLLTAAQLQAAITSEFNPVRVGFGGPEMGEDIWVRDVLNIGVSPVRLLETLKQKFLADGGRLFEQAAFAGATVHPNGVAVQTSNLGPMEPTADPDAAPTATQFTARLMLDAMGHGSPIVQQARQGQRPAGVCLVVGTCAQGFPDNQTGDLIYSFTPIQNQCQYFWEAFPAQDGRTTYLFTYVDASADRQSLTDLFDEYFRLLPEYQGVALEDLQFQRALFGFFPSYRQSPLRLGFDRILAVGDSSGSQSPLSFGGFGAMVRHLGRLSEGVRLALNCEALSAAELDRLQPYQPSLSVTWLFQKSMSVGMGQSLHPNQINQLLADVFETMASLGEPVLKPFLQDVVTFSGLLQTLGKTALVHPAITLKILPQVGIPALVDWMGHYLALGLSTGLAGNADRLLPWIKTLPPQQQFAWWCRIQAWKYGSGRDY
jgi:lycopene cyclase CruP